MIIEPITTYGYRMATPYFYKEIRKICDYEKIPFIVNECHTGTGITGKMWAHQNWFMDNSPDLVTFANRSVAAGFYSKKDFSLNEYGVSYD